MLKSRKIAVGDEKTKIAQKRDFWLVVCGFFSYLILTWVRLRRSALDEIEAWYGILDWRSVLGGLLLVL